MTHNDAAHGRGETTSGSQPGNCGPNHRPPRGGPDTTHPRYPTRGGTPGDQSQSKVGPARRRFRGVYLIPLSGVGFLVGFCRWSFRGGYVGWFLPLAFRCWGPLLPGRPVVGGMLGPNTNPTWGEAIKTSPHPDRAGGSVGVSGRLPNFSPRGWLFGVVFPGWSFLGCFLFWVSPLVGLVLGPPPPWAVGGFALGWGASAYPHGGNVGPRPPEQGRCIPPPDRMGNGKSRPILRRD